MVSICKVIMRIIICSVVYFVSISYTINAAEENYWFDIKKTSFKNSDKIQWHGYYEFEYWDTEGKNSTFDAHKIVTWLGVQVNEKVFAASELEYEHFPRLKDSGAQKTGGSGEVKIDSAQLRFTPISDSVLYMGIYYVPFGIEYMSYPGQKNKLVTRPKVMKSGNIIPGTWSDVGLGFNQVFSGVGQVDIYYINGDASNGGISRDSSNGGNNRKSLGSRIMLDRFIEGFNIGGSFVSGEYDTQNSNVSVRTGFHIRVDSDKITGISIAPILIGEFVTGKDEKGYTDSSGIDVDRNVSGYYAQISSKIVPEIELAARYGQYSNNEDIDNNTKTETSIGFVLHMIENFQIKGEYQVNKEEGTELDNNSAALQFVAHW